MGPTVIRLIGELFVRPDEIEEMIMAPFRFGHVWPGQWNGGEWLPRQDYFLAVESVLTASIFGAVAPAPGVSGH